MKELPIWVRFYFYGIQGFADEVVFTAFLDFFLHRDWALKGGSAISSFFIYGSGGLFIDKAHGYLKYKRNMLLPFRLIIYVFIAYTWEFCFGLLLRTFNMCPWDYSKYTYNFKGLITLEYAPGWFFLGILQDNFVEYLNRILVKDHAFSNGSGIHIKKN